MATDKLINNIKVVLANSYSLYLKTQNYHWNVSGPNFQALHQLFEQHYTNLADAVDEIAERIKALGGIAPGGFASFAKLRTLKDGDETLNSAGMLKDLCNDHELILKCLVTCLKEAEINQAEVTESLIIDRMSFHEKALWMLKSSLG